MDVTETNRAIMAEFARLLYGERDVTGAFETFVAEDYIQHNPGFGDGRAAAIAGLRSIFDDPESRFEVVRMLVDGDLAAIHVRASPAGRGTLAVADFYRLRQGRIVEHWDVLQPIPEVSGNPHPMF